MKESVDIAGMTSQARDYAAGGQPLQIDTRPLRPTHIDLEAQSPISPTLQNDAKSPVSPAESVRFRKVARSNTAKTYRPERRGREWVPGEEPGIDLYTPSDEYTRSSLSKINETCDITVVDFSQDDMKLHHLDNRSLSQFLKESRPVWASCRWISVNGLSWDVISLLGRDKHLHRLAIEDLMNPKNRTKADWYSDHTYMVLPLQKLIHLHSDSDCDPGCSDWEDGGSSSEKTKVEKKEKKKKKKKKKSRRCWPLYRAKRMEDLKQQPPKPLSPEVHNSFEGSVIAHTSPTLKHSLGQVRTLQRYNGGPNEERIIFMEKHSALSSKNLGVGVEQVSMFLTSDNTVISFFENSAEDIETPLIRRLSSPETILRRCSDASMVTQVRVNLIWSGV